VIVSYKGRPIHRYEMDRVVDGLIVIELKATKHLCEADHNQLLGYLTATESRSVCSYTSAPKSQRFTV